MKVSDLILQLIKMQPEHEVNVMATADNMDLVILDITAVVRYKDSGSIVTSNDGGTLRIKNPTPKTDNLRVWKAMAGMKGGE